MDLCYAVKLYEQLLDWWITFGPELPNLQPDPSFDYLVESYVLFNETLRAWYGLPGWDGDASCFLK